MKRWLAFGALFGALAAAARTRAAQVESLRETGPADKRFNLVVVGDGYRDVDQAQLSQDAKAAIDYFFSVSPLKQYAGFFNVKLVHVISKDNGADRGSFGDVRDTALNGTFFCDYGPGGLSSNGSLERLLCVDDGLAQAAAAQDVPEVNFTLAIVNDPKYGGSGGGVCAASIDPLSVQIVAHEVGHSLAGLADEYSFADSTNQCTGDCEPNVTLKSARDQIKWRNWIDATTPVPTTPPDQYPSVVGLFEGARYQTTGIYRPKLNCKMRDLSAEYCEVCQEQFIKSIWSADNIKMIEDSAPTGDAVMSASCDSIKLPVTTPPIAPSTYRFMWTVDGMPQLDADNAVELAPGALSLGAHQVKVDVTDATDMVRTDPDNLLHDSRTWTVTVSKNDCPIPMGGSGGTTGAAGAAGTSNVSGGGAGALGGSGSGGASTAGAGAFGLMSGSAGALGAGAPMPPPPAPSGCGCYVAHGKTGETGSIALTVAMLSSTLRRRRRGYTSRKIAVSAAP